MLFNFCVNIKVIEINICLDNWKHRLELESARAALCKWAVCTRQIFLSKTFTNSHNMQKQYKVYVIKQMVNVIACTIKLWSPWIADFRCWTKPELSIPAAGQNDRGLWGRECISAAILDLCLRKTRADKSTEYRDVIFSGKAPFSKCFPSTLKRKAPFSRAFSTSSVFGGQVLRSSVDGA